MKKVLVYLWFLHYYYEILDYTIVDYRSINSYKDENIINFISQPQNQNYHIQVHVLRRKRFEGRQDKAKTY